MGSNPIQVTNICDIIKRGGYYTNSYLIKDLLVVHVFKFLPDVESESDMRVGPISTGPTMSDEYLTVITKIDGQYYDLKYSNREISLSFLSTDNTPYYASQIEPLSLYYQSENGCISKKDLLAFIEKMQNEEKQNLKHQR